MNEAKFLLFLDACKRSAEKAREKYRNENDSGKVSHYGGCVSMIEYITQKVESGEFDDN